MKLRKLNALIGLLAGAVILTTVPVPAATPMAGITSSSKFTIYYGSDFSTNNLNVLTNFDVVVLDPDVATCQPASVAYLQNHGVKFVLAYISIGEEPASVATIVGNGDGPVYFTNGVIHYESNGVASFYVDQNWNGSSYVSDGFPDTNIYFSGRFIWPNADWQWVIDNQRIGGSTALPGRSLAGLQQLLGARTSDTDTNRNDNFGANGVFLDTLDTAGPFVNTWGYYAWAAPAMQQTVAFIHNTYANKTVFANRGVFFYNPTLLNTTYNIRSYDYNIRPYINGSLFESYTLDSTTSPTNSPYFADNKNEYAPKMINEANRPDGFTMFCVDYQMGRSNFWYQQAVTNSVLANGWVEYESPLAGLDPVGSYMLANPPAVDTAPPVWDSTAANTAAPVAARVGIQSVAPGQNTGDAVVHWDVARDQTPPVRYNILVSTNPAFTSATVYSNVVFGIGDGWAQDPTTAFANKYTLTGLPAGTNYFRVRAHDSTASKFEETNAVTLSLVVRPAEVSNPLTTNVVVNGNLADWNNLRSFPANTVGTNTPVNWVKAWLGHDLTRYYLAFTNASAVTINSAVVIYFDTDATRTTGFRGGANNFPVGAEYMLVGGSLYQYAGTGLDWNWAFVGSVTWQVSGNNAECSFSRAWLANAANLNLFFYGDNPSVGGSAVVTMPNNALQVGGGGGYLNYRIHDVSNPLLTSSITLDGSLADWAPYPAFGINRLTATNPTVFLAAWMAHDPTNFYVAFTNDAPVTIDSSVNVYFDTDASRTTGFRGGGDNFPLGAEYLLQGGTLYVYAGTTGLDWNWTPVSTVTWHVSGKSAECAFPRSLIGDPNVANLIFVGDNGAALGQNYLPSYASSVGGGGELFTYRKNDIANSVTNNAIHVDGSVADWSTLAPFGTDPLDANGTGDQLDWGNLFLANDPTNFYFAFQNYTAITSLNGVWNVYLDTDGNRLTGFRGGSDTFPVGADYLIQGINVYKYTGTGLDWNWTSVGTVAYSWSLATAEYSFPRTWLASPSLVKVFYYGDNTSAGGVTTDLSPDNALKTGGGGAFYTYRVK